MGIFTEDDWEPKLTEDEKTIRFLKKKIEEKDKQIKNLYIENDYLKKHLNIHKLRKNIVTFEEKSR